MNADAMLYILQPILDDPPSVIVLGLSLMLSGVLLGAVAVACGDWAINAALRAWARRLARKTLGMKR